MQPIATRIGARIQRRIGVVLVVLGILAGVYVLLPHAGVRPALALVALDASGRFQDTARIPLQWADTSFTGSYGATARVPLVLALLNTGSSPATPSSLELSVPGRYRLLTSDGQELPHRFSPTSPLVRYTVAAGLRTTLEPGRLPVVPPGLDTLWLEPVVPALYCVAGADSVPDFIPATPPDAGLLANIEMFYSFVGADLRGRQTGLLDIRIDSSLVRAHAAPTPPIFDTDVANAGQPLPQMGTLRFAGTATARCGAPEDPLVVSTQVWRTGNGGRFLVLFVDRKPRKYLFDLDGDSTVDLEMWDPDGDGRFESRRQARFAIPAFLLPPPPAPPLDPAIFASLSPDSAARLDRFYHARATPYLFPPAPDTLAADSAALDRFRRPAEGVAAAAPEQPGAGLRSPALPPGVHLLGHPIDSPAVRTPHRGRDSIPR